MEPERLGFHVSNGFGCFIGGRTAIDGASVVYEAFVKALQKPFVHKLLADESTLVDYLKLRIRFHAYQLLKTSSFYSLFFIYFLFFSLRNLLNPKIDFTKHIFI